MDTTDLLPFDKRLQAGTKFCDSGEPVRSCDCAKCRGTRNQSKGTKAQRRARKLAGIAAERFSTKTHNEESWRSSGVRWESKAGAQANPVATRYLAARAQSDAAKAIGDTRTFAAIFAADGSMPLIVVRADELEGFIAGILSDWSGNAT